MPLTDAACRNARVADKPRKLADEKGLYLLVKEAGKYWRYDYRYLGKRQTMALGVYPEVDLKSARNRLDAARRLLADGLNPMDARVKSRRERQRAQMDSFEAVAREWHKFQSKRWQAVTASKNLKHLEADAFPTIGRRPIAGVEPPEIVAMLRKVESRGAAYTASRVRELCSQVFRYAISQGRARFNPAADLTRSVIVPAARHRPAITDRRQFAGFLQDLKKYQRADRVTLLATKFALLTFVRSQELRKASWDEFDQEAAEWRIPAGRMKMAKGSNQAHIVPLSSAALEVLSQLRELSGHGHYVFPNSHGADDVMSENTIGRMLIRMGYQHRQTLHGFRASARSLLSERGWSVAALERQLDHVERNKVIAAYARSEHLEERRKIMEDWGLLVSTLENGENVIPLKRAA